MTPSRMAACAVGLALLCSCLDWASSGDSDSGAGSDTDLGGDRDRPRADADLDGDRPRADADLDGDRPRADADLDGDRDRPPSDADLDGDRDRPPSDADLDGDRDRPPSDAESRRDADLDRGADAAEPDCLVPALEICGNCIDEDCDGIDPWCGYQVDVTWTGPSGQACTSLMPSIGYLWRPTLCTQEDATRSFDCSGVASTAGTYCWTCDLSSLGPGRWECVFSANVGDTIALACELFDR